MAKFIHSALTLLAVLGVLALDSGHAAEGARSASNHPHSVKIFKDDPGGRRLVIPAGKRINRQNKQAMPDGTTVPAVQLKPRPGSAITKVVFADLKWASDPGRQP